MIVPFRISGSCSSTLGQPSLKQSAASPKRLTTLGQKLTQLARNNPAAVGVIEEVVDRWLLDEDDAS